MRLEMGRILADTISGGAMNACKPHPILNGKGRRGLTWFWGY
jgi:hypothetical protein